MPIISSARLPLVLIMLTGLLTCVSLSGCSNTRSPPEEVARDPVSGTAFARVTLGKMPDAARQAFKDKLKAETTRLDAELKSLLTSKQPGQLGRMAVFVQARKANLQELKRRITIENNQLAQIDPEHVDFSGSDTNSALTHAQEINAHRSVIAQAILMARVEQNFLRRALSISPVLQEASQRQDEAESTGNPGTIPDYIDDMKREPCLFISPDVQPAAAISIRGIELGVNRRKVLDSLCASENGEVRIQTQTRGQTYSPDSVAAGARLLAWEAYKKGVDAYSPDYTGVSAWLARPENSAEIASLVRHYLKTTRFCLHCTGAGHENNNILSVQYAPEGTVVALKRFQRFIDGASVDINDRPLPAGGENPQLMSDVLDPLRNQYGQPSFIFKNMVAWVYLDGKTPLQPEVWSVQSSSDGLSKQIKYNNSSFHISGPLDPGTPDFMSLYRALSATPTPATYCVSKYAYDGLDSTWPLAAIYADRFGTRPYDPSAAAPGETDNCGVIIYAVMDVTPKDNHEIYINDRTPVYAVTLSILNVGRLSAIQKREAQTVIDRMKALTASAEDETPVTLRR